MNSVGIITTAADAPAVATHRAGGVVLLAIHNPPVNALNRRVRRALLDALLAVRDDPQTRAVVIASEGRMFSGGGDLREVGQPDPPDSTTLGDLAELVEGFPKPVVVALQGKTIGGGVLLGMACHARIGAHDALLALPEVNLGFVPGAGGTQRLPRLVGVEAALRMVALSQSMDAAAAQAAGLLDAVVPEGGNLREAATAHALAIAEGTLPWRRTAGLRVPDGAAPEALIARYRTLATERWGDREAAQEAITLIASAAERPFAEGAQHERKAYLRLASSTQTQGLVAAFFAARNPDPKKGATP
ncbi:enoyl-CoA hydratase/isomerase family protein [Hydrogenophaga sp. 2FB]|uniref:enoyl-CoA hydratase/isomerase family protein n=1 Tax=Hydrogenophaga sp. 2FB TaxID=2502187 RepID=UPI001485451B|nr:enoyl-CoA hydratase/isomerase family protein [Hydrogenophaga sp. 2FB]